MDDKILFAIGLLVCFIFLGGVLIHLIAGQKLPEVDEPETQGKNEQNSD